MMKYKRQNKFNKKAGQNGFSLIELMIAMMISLVLVFACASLYTSLKSTITISQNLAKVQESLRGSYYLLSRSIRQAESVTVSGAIGSNQSLTVVYAEPPASGAIYNCLGNPITASGDSETYSSDGNGLYCDDGSGPQLIALDVERLGFSDPSGNNDTGLDVNIKVEGMPDSFGDDGLFFKLALRQKILLELTQ